MLELFPETALVEDGVLAIGGCTAAELADEFGTPLVVYCERTIRSRAQAYRAAAPGDALVVYGTKAFPNVALLRVLAEEGLGADVSTLGERDTAFRFTGTLAVHDWVMWISLVLLVGHLYLAVIHPATRHALRGMTLGSVRYDWAEQHHPKWVRRAPDGALSDVAEIPAGQATPSIPNPLPPGVDPG